MAVGVECAALGCGVEVPSNRFMCWPHWKRVPRRIQDPIWVTAGSGSLEEYSRCRAAAVAAIAVKEGHGVAVELVGLMADFGVGVDGYPLKTNRNL